MIALLNLIAHIQRKIMKVKINLAKPFVAEMHAVSRNQNESLPSMAKLANPQPVDPYTSFGKPVH